MFRPVGEGRGRGSGYATIDTTSNSEEIEELKGQPDGTIRVAKNRHGEFDGKFNF